MIDNFFEWDSDFTTGHTEIDEQHYGLVKTINELVQLCFQTENIEDCDIESLQKRLTDYTLEHFQTEEKLMQEFSIDPRHKNVHEKVHQDFVKKVSAFFQSPANLKNKNSIYEINEFLIRWLAYHILSMDKSLIRQVDIIKKEANSPEAAYYKELKEYEVNTEPLLKALKSLFSLVAQKNKELEIINEGLEKKIKERTQDLEEANCRLKKLSLIDELTGLPNRRFVMQEIQQLIYQWERYGTPFSVLFIDLDKFKAVNDNYGHECGDQVLKWATNFIKKNTRKNDLLCRLGGDEFILVSQHCKGHETLSMAEKFLTLISNLKDNEKPPYWNPSFSLGIIEMDDSIDSVSDLLIKVDSAMYKSKRAGGNSVTLFSLSNNS